MTITAEEMRAKVKTYNDAITEKEIKAAKDYLDRVVEPTIVTRADKGYTFIDIDIPLTIDPARVTKFLNEKGFVVKGGGFHKTIEW